jgi:hypothetical protein
MDKEGSENDKNAASHDRTKPANGFFHILLPQYLQNRTSREAGHPTQAKQRVRLLVQ